MRIKMVVKVEVKERATLSCAMDRMTFEMCQNNCPDKGSAELDMCEGKVNWIIKEKKEK